MRAPRQRRGPAPQHSADATRALPARPQPRWPSPCRSPRVGVRKSRLDLHAGNEAAIALDRSEGFRVEGVERDQIRYEDTSAMVRFVLAPDRHSGPWPIERV